MAGSSSARTTRTNSQTRTTTLALAVLLAFIPANAPATGSASLTAADALAKTILALPQTESQSSLLYFIDDQEIQSLRRTGQLDCAKDFSNRMPLSEKSPQPLYNKTKSGDGGIVISHSDVFAEGYFRQHIGQADFKNANGGVITAKLIKGQPWFEWNVAKQAWTYRTDGAQAAILGNFHGPQNFFRGTSIDEWSLIRVYQILASPQMSAADASELTQKLATASQAQHLSAELQASLKALDARSASLRKAPISERNGAAQDIFDKFLTSLSRHPTWDSVFFTPDQRIAQNWAKSALLEWTIDEKELGDFLKTDAIYVGIEFEYIELAAATRSSLQSFFKSARFIAKDRYLPPVIDDETRF